MSRYGLTMADVVEVCREVGIEPVTSLHGVQCGGKPWRLEYGGGIAGNGGKWWLRVINEAWGSRQSSREPIGPVDTKKALREMLLKKWPILLGNLPKPEHSVDLKAEMAAYSIKVAFETLIRRAQRSGVLVVADAEASAIRLIPTSEVPEDGDLRGLGVTVRVDSGCGGGASRVGGDPTTHG